MKLIYIFLGIWETQYFLICYWQRVILFWEEAAKDSRSFILFFCVLHRDWYKFFIYFAYGLLIYLIHCEYIVLLCGTHLYSPASLFWWEFLLYFNIIYQYFYLKKTCLLQCHSNMKSFQPKFFFWRFSLELHFLIGIGIFRLSISCCVNFPKLYFISNLLILPKFIYSCSCRFTFFIFFIPDCLDFVLLFLSSKIFPL